MRLPVILLLPIVFSFPNFRLSAQNIQLPAVEVSPLAAYLLGPGDQLNIQVLGYEEFNGNQTILPDGTISLPVIGNVIAAGKTTSELARELTKRLDPYLIQPSVGVRVASLRPIVVTVTGEVQRPGPLQLSIGAGSGATGSLLPTISQAILQAGGVTREADIRGIVLRRIKAGGENADITLNLWESLKALGGPQDLLLRDGDQIFVPKARALSEVDTQVLSRSTFSPRSIRVSVVGEVKAPGDKEVPPNTTISQAVAAAGGPTNIANLAAVRFVRLLPNGTVQQQGVNISNLGDTVPLQNGDVVVVPRTDVSQGLDLFRQVLDPLILLRIFR